jgi:Bifunctional DNA primase/polymerase, N-terminal
MAREALLQQLVAEPFAQPRVFGDHAVRMASVGLAVVPLSREREPYVHGFDRWSRPPGLRTLAGWAEKYPGANIGVLPGLSNVLVADVDDASQVAAVEELLGPTPLRSRTSRGIHLWYAKPQDRLPGNLRKYGLEVDLKAGSNLVIAPPSIHESGVAYALDEGCTWLALKELVQPRIEKLRKFIDAAKKVEPVELREMRDGSRGQWLNDSLCKHAASCGDFGEMLDVARTANQSLRDRGLEPLDDHEVIKRAEGVWRDAEAGKLEQWVGGEGVARLTGRELQVLCRLDTKTGPDAYTLLAHFKLQHSARCKRGETFNITPKAMQRDDVIPGWSRERYERSRDLLLLGGFIERVSEYTNTAEGRSGAQYRLTTYSAAGAGAVQVTLGCETRTGLRQTGS